MADFELTLPDGSKYAVTADTEQQAFAALQKMLGGSIPQPEPERGLLGRTADWFSGANREENIGGPLSLELPMTSGQSAQMTALMATTMSPDRLKSGILKIEPDAQFREDSFGNLVALWPRKDESGKVTGYQQFYPNPAGLDVSDVMRTSGVVAAATPIGRALKVVGLPTTGLLGGATIGATEAALIEGASSQLSDAPYQYSDIPYGALGGAGGEVLGRAVQRLVGIIRSAGPQSVVDASGNLLPKYAEIVKKAGLDPNQVSAAVAADITNMVRSGAEGSQAAITAMSRGLPVPVPMTKGQITGSAGQQLFEDMAGKEVYGKTAEALITRQRQRQQEALTENLDQILEGLRPGSAPISRGVGGINAQEALVLARKAEGAEANRLYTEARETTAMVDPDAALDIADSMRGAYSEGYSPSTAPIMFKLLDEFDTISLGGKTPSGTVAPGDIRTMMEWRQKVSNLRKGPPTVEASAATDVLKKFDDQVESAINDALLAGDADAVAKWGLAISNYADFASKWKSKGGVLNLLTEKVTRDGERVLKIAPEQAADVIFGATVSGLASKTGLARDLTTLKSTLPDDEWNQLRQDAFIRLMDTSKGAFRSGEQQVSGVNFKKAWENLREKNPSVVNALFTPDERKLFQQFADVSARATNTAVNASNSAAAMGGIIQRLASSFGGTQLARFMMTVPLARGFTEALGGARAVGATKGVAPLPRTPLTIGGAGLGAAAANTEEGRRQINSIPPVVGNTYNKLMGLLVDEQGFARGGDVKLQKPASGPLASISQGLRQSAMRSAPLQAMARGQRGML
jgi:hypothetical protein